MHSLDKEMNKVKTTEARPSEPEGLAQLSDTQLPNINLNRKTT